MRPLNQSVFLLLILFPLLAFNQDLGGAPATATEKSDQNENNPAGGTNLLQVDLSNWETFQNLINQGELAGYFSLDQIETIMANLKAEFPELFLPVEILGKTFENREIRLHCLTKNNGNTNLKEQAKNKVIGMVTALHHPREPMSLSMLLFLVYRILVNYNLGNQEYVTLLEDQILCFLPVVNVDGYNMIEETFKEQNKFIRVRKNRNSTGTKTCTGVADRGVDLNRNYDYGWGLDNIGSSADECGEDYRGSAPFSEPETQAIRDFVEKYKDSLKVAVNIHAYGNLWVIPFNCYVNDDPYKTKRVVSIYNDFSQNTVLPEGAKIGNAIKTVAYTANGEASDWFLGKYGIISMSPEIGVHLSEGFFPKKDLIYSVISSDYDGVYYMLGKLSPKVKLYNVTESKQENDQKSVMINLFNEAYRNITKAEIQINVVILARKGFLGNNDFPQLSLTDSEPDQLESPASTPLKVSLVDSQNNKQNETELLTYSTIQTFNFKSWSTVLAEVVLPQASFEGFWIEVTVNEGNRQLYNSVQGFGGASASPNEKVSILLISIAIAVAVTAVIILLSKYCIKSIGDKENNMFSKSQPPGMKFAQIDNEDLSADSGRL